MKYVPKLKKQAVQENHKYCVRCKTEKPFESFKPNKKLKSGLASWCRSCENEYDCAYSNKLYEEDTHFKWKTQSRQTLRDVIYRSGLLRLSFETEFKEVIGCSIDEFKKWIEDRFQPGMTWANYGKGKDKWSIDHVKSIMQSEIGENINHYTNLQPMWYSDNSKKGKK